MPYYDYTPIEHEEITNEVLDDKFPPVARFRLLSTGLEPYHRLAAVECDVVGDKGCIACGICVDGCPVLRKEPERLGKTEQRTSMALENTVADDCEQCYACILACPQVDTKLKDYTVDTRVPEVIGPSPAMTYLDKYMMAVVALVLGVLLGVFLDISRFLAP
jgi:ferredoxin